MRNFLTTRNDDWGFGLLDKAFEDFFKPVYFSGSNQMRTDVKQTENGYELSVDMPGFEKQDINLTLSDGYLTVEASRKETNENDKYVHQERSISCRLSYYVGEAVTEEDIKAKYQNGTLILNYPKKDKKEPPRKMINID